MLLALLVATCSTSGADDAWEQGIWQAYLAQLESPRQIIRLKAWREFEKKRFFAQVCATQNEFNRVGVSLSNSLREIADDQERHALVSEVIRLSILDDIDCFIDDPVDKLQPTLAKAIAKYPDSVLAYGSRGEFNAFAATSFLEKEGPDLSKDVLRPWLAKPSYYRHSIAFAFAERAKTLKDGDDLRAVLESSEYGLELWRTIPQGRRRQLYPSGNVPKIGK